MPLVTSAFNLKETKVEKASMRKRPVPILEIPGWCGFSLKNFSLRKLKKGNINSSQRL